MSETDLDDFLAHYGVKGMKWGQRGAASNRPEGVSAKVNRDAKKDAQEFARAKMFYGEGAGNRRKLIKATVEQKSKTNPSYKKAFDYHAESQDMSKHASKAQRERKRKDVAGGAAKTARGINRSLVGPFGPALGASVAIGAYSLAKSTGTDKVVKDAAKQTMKNAQKVMSDRDAQKAVADWLKTQNFG